MAQAKMEFDILEDGTISCKTDGIPGEHHKQADEFLDYVQAKQGGTRTTKQRGPKKQHHVHTHDHLQAGHGHTHD